MADFVAVIRRAVDGLATNTPETRAKVYEKARGAVQRQLENMKPRPPEEMLRRQMDKLQLAITEVESEHAEAISAADDGFPYPGEEAASVPAAAAVLAPAEIDVPARAEYAEPERLEPVAAEPVWHHDEGRDRQPSDEPAATFEAQSEQWHEPGRVVSEPEHVQPAWDQVDEPVSYENRAEPDVAEQADAFIAPLPDQPTSPRQAAAYDDPAASDSGSFFDAVPESPAEHARFEPQSAPSADEDLPYPAPEQRPQIEPPYDFTGSPSANAEPGWHAEPSVVETRLPFDRHGWRDEEHDRREDELAAAWNDVPELVPAGPVEPIGAPSPSETIGGPSSADHVEAHFDQETHVAADAVRMPAVSELLPMTAARPAEDPENFFADYIAADAQRVEPPRAAPPRADQPRIDDLAMDEPKPADRDPWSDLEDLIGYSKDQQQQPSARVDTRVSRNDDDLEDLMPSPAKPYRVTPVKRRNYAGIVLGLVGLLLVAGGAYAVWLNRDSLDDIVGGLVSSTPTAGSVAQQTPAAPTAGTAPATPRAPSSTSAPATPQQQAANTQTPPHAPATADGSASSPKFTQRLMPDGSESDQGPGAAGTLAQNAEGQSVAQLNAPPVTPAPAAQAPAGAAPATGNPVPAPATSPLAAAPQAAAPPTTIAPPAPNANPADTPAVAGEKMFLYEERLGQTAPTAIDGTVSWSLLHEAGGNGRPPEPEVQGRITIPGRGLTALMTFKRNTDPSLPASHLIEIVFAVPPDFEGGAIDSVQRIAMKSTEQDRGNALIAVPAKITDDFHMIALNDFPDARNTNLELLRSRNWIDIPVAYRNGRRALLTLQKGAEGEKAFNAAIAEWAKMPPAPGSQ